MSDEKPTNAEEWDKRFKPSGERPMLKRRDEKPKEETETEEESES